MERRSKERLNSDLEVTITYEKQMLRTKTRNISDDGIFISAPPYLCPLDTNINMALTFKQENRTIIYLLPGLVVRSTGEGLALQYSASENMAKTLQQLACPQIGSSKTSLHPHRTRHHERTS
ncbi:MAG: PilZ domain-containing protein [Gammaproteobacteria bacterium]|jgi:hypothetical protein